MIVSVDPGLSGGVALVDGPSLIDVVPMPTTLFQVNPKKQMVDGRELADHLYHWIAVHDVRRAVVERVGPRPNQGVSSMFNFGMSYGIVLGVFAALNMPVDMVSPQQWKKELELGSDKDLSRHMAVMLWPDFSETFSRKKDDGLAEAALLGYWFEEYSSF